MTRSNKLVGPAGASRARPVAPTCAPRGAAVVLLCAAALMAAGCSTLRSPGMGTGPSATAVVDAAGLTPAERQFVTGAAAKGMYEIEVSRLAAQRAINPGVRSYAQTMVSHRARAHRELVALMSARGIAPPKGLAADKATKLHRLASLPPSAAFDHGYIRVVGVEDHVASIAQFERARREVKDRELQAWIDRNLATLRSHLSAARSLSATLAG